MATIKYEDLDLKERQLLTAKYGIQPKSGGGFSKYIIDYVRDLNDDEKMFFQEKSFLSPHFITQSLYKLKGNLQPLRFNKVIKEYVEKNPNLRTNYVQLEDRVAAIVFENRTEIPPVNFRSMATMDSDEINNALRTIMEADMREMFDLTRGSLIRFSIYKTGEDEYAVLATMSHLIFSGVNLNEIFGEVVGLNVTKSVIKSALPTADIDIKMSDPNARAYWKRMLENLPPAPKIPYAVTNAYGKKESKVFRKKISEDLTGELKKITKSNRMLLMAFIETAWSLLLADHDNLNDVYFSALLPGNQRNSKIPAVRAMPVRIKISDDLTVEQLVMNTFQQLLVSKPYSTVQLDELQELSGSSERIFNHFLSFYNFMEDEKEYSEAKGTETGELVLRNTWNSVPSNIGLYFQQKNGSLALTLIYNSSSFVNDDESRLIKRFYRIMIHMIADYKQAVHLCLTRMKDRLKAEESQKVDVKNIALYVRYAILSVGLFDHIANDDLDMLQRNSNIQRYFEGDRISGDILADNILILVKGRAARNVDTGDGWYIALDIARERQLLNLTTAFLEKPKLPMSIEILTDEAEVIFVKKESLENLIHKNNIVGKRLLIHALREMEKYQYLWIQS